MVFNRFITEINKRKLFILLAGVSLISGLLFVGNITLKKYRGLERLILVKKNEFSNFKRLKEDYLRGRNIFDYIEKKTLSAKAMESPIMILEEIGIMTGLKENITTLKSLEEKPVKGYLERSVDIKIEGIDLNQLINFLYKIENNKILFAVNGFAMKSRFDNPNLLDININVAVISKVSGD